MLIQVFKIANDVSKYMLATVNLGSKLQKKMSKYVIFNDVLQIF